MRETPTLQTKPIVVAVDGSPESENALRWAADHAEVTASPLRIITCYQRYRVTGQSAGLSWEHFESTKKTATLAALDVIERVMGEAEVDHVVTEGPIDRVMIEYSKTASMLVLGTRSSYGLCVEPRTSATDRITGKAACPLMSIPLEARVLQGAGL